MSKVSRTTLLRAALLLAIGLTPVFAIKIIWSPDLAQAQSSLTYQWKSVPIGAGGVVMGIIFNPTEPNLLYTRTDIGGAYRWDQSTQSWIPLMDFTAPQDWNLMGVDSLATDSVDPNRLYILAGTYTNEWTGQNGAVLRSTNRGNSFQRTDLPFKAGGNMPGNLMGERLAIDPNRNSILYLGARSGNGLWRSTDFGASWSKVSNFPNPGTYVQDANSAFASDIQGVVWVTFDKRTGTPGNPTQTIYVGVADKGNSVYRSTDGGNTWAAVPGQPTGFLPHHGILSSTGMLYISYSNGGGPFDSGKGDVWRFNPVNGTWTNISPVPSSSTDNSYGYGGLALDAQNPNTLMVAALNSWWPDTIIFRSLDGGATWTRIWDWAGYPNRTFRYVLDITSSPWLTYNTMPQLPEVTPKLGWIVGTLAIDPFNANRMMYGSGATLFGTTNLTNWDSGNAITITPMVKGLEHTAILDLISPPSGAHLISGLGDICGFRHDDLNAVPARMMGTPTFGNTTSLDYAERSPNFVVRSGNAGNNNVTRAAFSSDGGANWFQAGTEPAGVTAGGMVAAAADASRVVWSPEGAAVSFSTNNGSTWTTSQGIPNGAGVTSDRVNPMKFYGFSNGRFYVSTNGGASFTATAATGLPGFARIKALHRREGEIWLAGGGGGLWHSTDSGATFNRLGNVDVADGIGFGMAAPGRRYPALYLIGGINGVRGIFLSIDAGASWMRINDDQHQYGLTGSVITGDPRVFGRVYFGTNGRGIIRGDSTVIPVLTPRSVPGFPFVGSPTTSTVN